MSCYHICKKNCKNKHRNAIRIVAKKKLQSIIKIAKNGGKNIHVINIKSYLKKKNKQK